MALKKSELYSSLWATADMNGHRQPVCWTIAGPSGAGKTTFALKYLPEVADWRRK